MKIDINDLAKIKGIGAKTIERIREEVLARDGYVSEYDPALHLEPSILKLGDCLELMNGIPDSSVDMILVDLPYGTTACAWDSIIPLKRLWEHYKRILKQNGVAAMTAAQPFVTYLAGSNLEMYRYSWYWHKNKPTGFPNANYMPLRDIEEVLVFSQGKPNPAATIKTVYFPQGIIENIRKKSRNSTDTTVNNGERDGSLNGEYWSKHSNYPRQLIYFLSETVTVHPTQKPVELFEYLIKTYTNEGDVVLDNTAGVYTTAIAALNTGRRYICMEKELRYHLMGSKWVSLVKDGMDYKEAMKEVKKIFKKD